ncbi:macrophage mannose receptor 1-like isoform X2 [Uloborus diversus]|uniref:macrophage mannose receptor 1-like isoform X2 n=1 Tax=Uloborus diversus TaxID=327109 RepID=UPI00240A89C0|nr:macrophage mannose receptor 1-like isoform X2 [Uloborus diversus]
MATKLILGCAFVLLIICKLGVCCNIDWLPYDGSCYQASPFELDYTLARRYCQIANGDLAEVENIKTLQFINTLKNFDGQKTYWLKEDSRVTRVAAHECDEDDDTRCPTAIPPNPCPYARMLSIESGEPDDKRSFVCETADRKTQLQCPGGWSLYDSTCYKPMSIQVPYADAVQKCILLKGQLAVFDTEDKQKNAMALVLGRNQTFYVDAKMADTKVMTWSNGVQFTPYSGALRDAPEGENNDCLIFYSDPEHPTLFTWLPLKCETKAYPLCQRSAEILPTTPPSTEPPTTSLPYVCPHGHNWKVHENSQYCFWETTYETERLNWYQARAFCQSYGGDLASYDSEQQEDFGLGGAKGHYRGLWFGLKRGEDDIFRWSDGSVMRYTNWNYNEPKLQSRTKFCVKHGAISATWELDYCGVKRWFVCKAPKVQVQKIPDRPVIQKEPCNITDVSVYSTQWYLHGDYCYMAHEDAKYTWDTANTFCKDNGAHLASIHSFNETDFMLFITSTSPDSDFWIGLSSESVDSPLKWSDGTPVDFENEMENKTLIDSCISFKKTDGAWGVENCNRLLAVMCKRSAHSKTEFSTASPTPDPPGNCQAGWYPYGSKCYWIKGSNHARIASWATAAQACEDMQATLISIHSQSDQDFLTDLVCEREMSTWIGLRTLERGTLFQWRDRSRIDYTNWDANEPQYPKMTLEYEWMVPANEREMCTSMSYEPDSIGKWRLTECTEAHSYICEKPKDVNILEPSEKPFLCPNITGWLKLDTTCYGLFEDPSQEATWLDAQSICRQRGANLVSFKNVGVSNFLKRRYTRKNVYYWTAVREKSVGKYELVTGGSMLYANWMPGQPLSASSVMDNCVASNTDSSWVVKSCREKHQFICEWTPELREKKMPSNSSSRCPTNSTLWTDLGGAACYYAPKYFTESANDAVRTCFIMGGNLASFHSEEEVLQVASYLRNTLKPFVSHVIIGLSKRGDGSYAWLDHTPLDFTYWDEDEPDGAHCVKMRLSDGKWSDTACSTGNREFVCSMPKEQKEDEGEKSETKMNDTSAEEDVATKLTAGAIAGIIICILMLLAVVGLTIYHLCPPQKIRLTLLEQETE